MYSIYHPLVALHGLREDVRGIVHAAGEHEVCQHLRLCRLLHHLSMYIHTHICMRSVSICGSFFSFTT